MRKHQRKIELQCPEAIILTKLRQYIATLSQLLNLEERELEMVAGFLGHNIDVHREFYRLPEDTLQLAKCGKMFLLMDQGRLIEFAGKSLTEIKDNLDDQYFCIYGFPQYQNWGELFSVLQSRKLNIFSVLPHTRESLHQKARILLYWMKCTWNASGTRVKSQRGDLISCRIFHRSKKL